MAIRESERWRNQVLCSQPILPVARKDKSEDMLKGLEF